MGSIFKHTLIGAVVGLMLATAGWVVWWLGSLAMGADPAEQFPTLGLALGVGIVAALAATALTRLSQPHPAEGLDQDLQAEFVDLQDRLQEEKQKIRRLKRRKRRSHPLDRNPYLARVTPALRWHSLSRALARRLKAQPAGKPVFQVVHPEDVPAVDKAFTQARAEKKPQQVLCRFLIGDQSGSNQTPKPDSIRSDTKLLPPLTPSSFLYVRLDIWAKRDRHGKIVRYVCRFVDMTPLILQKELEFQVARKLLGRAKKRLRTTGQDLHRLKLSYRELYQNAPVMYFSLDHQGKLVTVNDTLLATLGYERLELQNKDYTVLLAPEARKSYVAIAENMPSQVGESETRWRKKDGALFDVWLHTVPVYDEQGQFVRYRNAGLDLSEKNRLANELRSRVGGL